MVKFHTNITCLALASVLGLSISPHAVFAQDSKPETKPEVKQEEPPKKDKKTEEYEKTIKDLTKYEGAMTFYVRKKELLLEIAESQLGKQFLVQPTLNTGVGTNAQAGHPISYGNIDVFRLDKNGDERVWLVRPRTKFRWKNNSSLANSLERSFPEAYLADYRIEGYNPETKKYLINIGSLFQGELFNVNKFVGAAVSANLSIDREKTNVDAIKAFPENTVIRMALHYNASPAAQNPLLALLGLGGGNGHLEDARSVPVKVTYNLWFRNEKSDYMPRLSDQRVGYFTTDFTDLGQRYYEWDRDVRLVNRWNLKKKDPNAAMSEPVKPIVWTIDNSVPKEYRPAVRRAILAWNQAFEKIGFKNAVQVQDQPNDPNYDHADGRYNVYRWTTTAERDGAIALFRTDPFTGEILNAGVNFDPTFVFQGMIETDRYITPSNASPARVAEIAGRMVVRDDSQQGHKYHDHVKNWSAALNPQFDFSGAAAKFGWNEFKCEHGQEAGQRFSLYAAGARAVDPTVAKQKMIEQLITEVTAHEVGHCFGLRHNFVASQYLTTQELKNDAIVSRVGTSASVMDYNAVNVSAILAGGRAYYSTVIGPYDEHAIKYGYLTTKATSMESELPTLKAIASRSGERGLEFMTDEDADSFNPRVVRFDGAGDSINFTQQTLDLMKKLRSYAITQLPRKGESYEERNSLLITSFNSVFRECMEPIRYIGGVVANRSFKGDAGERPNLTPVAAADQRRALRTVLSNALSPTLLDGVPSSVLNTMARSFESPQSNGWTAPLKSMITNQQLVILSSLLSSDRIDMISENELKAGKSAYTLAEHYEGIVGTVFGTKSPSSIHRSLQKSLVGLLMKQGSAPEGGVNEDARSLANMCLRSIVSMSPSKSSDSMLTAHYQEIRSQIARYFGRTRVEGVAGGGGGGMPDLSALFGHKSK